MSKRDEPQYTHAEKMGMIRRFVKQKAWVPILDPPPTPPRPDDDVREMDIEKVIKIDRRRGKRSGSTKPEDHSEDLPDSTGRRSVPLRELVTAPKVTGPTDLWRPARGPSAPPAALRPDQMKRAAAWDHTARPLTMAPWQALHLHEVEGLSFAKVGLRMRPTKTKIQVQRLIEAARNGGKYLKSL